jgi:HEAT repeat protein
LLIWSINTCFSTISKLILQLENNALIILLGKSSQENPWISQGEGQMPLFGPPDISKLESKRDVDGLIHAMNSRMDYLIQAEAVHALGRIGGDRVVNELGTQLAQTYDLFLRECIIETLGELGNPKAVNDLCYAFHTEIDREILVKIADALSKLDWEPVDPIQEAIYCISHKDWDRCIKIGAPAINVLSIALGAGETSMRESAALTLGMIGDPCAIEILVGKGMIEHLVFFGMSSVEPLIQLLTDEDSSKVTKAVIALGEIGDSHATDPLIDLLKHEVTLTRCAAVKALGQIGSPKATEHLKTLINDPEIQVRREVVKALGQIEGEKIFDWWVACLKTGKKEACLTAIDALVKNGKPEVINYLIPMVTSYDKEIRETVLDGLVKFGAAAQPPLQAALQNRAFLESVLEFTRNKMSTFWVDLLIPYLKDGNKEVRFSIASRFLFYRDQRIINFLIQALQDSDWNYRIRAAKYLGTIGDQTAVEPLFKLLADPYSENYAGEDIGYVPDGPLERHWESGTWFPVRKEVADALRKITKDPEILRVINQTTFEIRD